MKPHLVETFKLSRDKQFVEKLHDVVGLYLNPPDKAIVLCVDEKSQIQALERTRPSTPLRQGIPTRQTHDYTRHGTTTLFAALSMLDGKVIGDCMPAIGIKNSFGSYSSSMSRLHWIWIYTLSPTIMEHTNIHASKNG